MSCTDDKPCLAPMLRWVHSKTCQDRTRRPRPPPMTRDEALALVIQCARVCAMEGATRPDRWRLDDALKAYDRAPPTAAAADNALRIAEAAVRAYASTTLNPDLRCGVAVIEALKLARDVKEETAGAKGGK